MLCARCGIEKKSQSGAQCARCAHLKLGLYGKRQMPRIWTENKRTIEKMAKRGMEKLLTKFFGA